MKKRFFIFLFLATILVGNFLFAKISKAQVKIENIYSTYDGRIISQYLNSWQEVKNSFLGGLVYDSESYQNAPDSNYVDYKYIYGVTRRFDVFNTTNIPLGAEIKSARFYFYPVSTYNYDDSGIVLVKSLQTSTSTFSLDEFDRFEFVNGASMQLADMVMNQYNYLELNQEALGWIEKGGWTKLGLVTTHDFYNIEPTFSNSLIAAFSESPGTDKDPYLEITYEIPEEPLGNVPVVIVPGIAGSYLEQGDGDEVWLNLDRMLLSWSDDYLDYLQMDETGASLNPVRSGDILRSVLVKDFMGGLIDSLEAGGYTEGEDLFVFPYDWRYDLDVTSGVRELAGVANLRDKLAEVMALTGQSQVDIVAHSMGGLVVKDYLEHFGSSSVNKFIDIATPHLGAPKALKILRYGDDMGISVLGFGLNAKRIKEITRNMSAVYQLLPSQSYFEIPGINYSSYFFDVTRSKQGIAYDYLETMTYLRDEGLNRDLLNANYNLHNRIDDLFISKAYNIVGCREATIGKIGKLNYKNNKNEYKLKYISGDGTVPLRSAMALNAPIVYSTGAEHSYLPSQAGVKELILATLQDDNSFNIGDYPEISNSDLICRISGHQVSVHSPMALHIYDEAGRHLGPSDIGGIDKEILGGQYDILDDNKFTFLPVGHDYRVEGRALGDGAFSLRVDKIVDDEYTEELYYHEIAIIASSSFRFQIGSEADNFINFDFDGDGIYEAKILPSAVLEGEGLDDLEAPTTQIKLDGRDTDEANFRDGVEIALEAIDNNGGVGVLKTLYSLDGNEWNEYVDTLDIKKAGGHSLKYYSVDRIGNIEEMHEFNFIISEYGDIDDLIQYIQKSYQEGKIYKKLVKNILIQKLESIEHTLEKAEARAGKRSDFVTNKCTTEGCVHISDKIFRVLNKLEEKLVQKQFESMLNILENYDKKNWLDHDVSEFIKDYLNYLKP